MESTKSADITSPIMFNTQKIAVAPVNMDKGVSSSCNSQHVPIAKHQNWFDAILSDDSNAIQQIIRNTEDASLLISGHFTYGDVPVIKKARRGSAVQLPLAVAAVAGATNSILTLLQAGVSPQQVDCHGNNVVHSMIAFLHYNRDMEDTIISKFQLLVDTVSVDVMREILHHENSFGLRPIEFAAQHGQGKMVMSIMNTPGVYMTKQQVVGLTCYKWYNITEYESTGSGSRADKSPLLLMTYADEECMDSLCEFVEQDIIRDWYRKKYSLNLPLIILWLMFRLMFVVTYMVYDMDMSVSAAQGLNFTGCVPTEAILLSANTRIAMTAYLCLQAIVSLLLTAKGPIGLFRQKGRPMITTLSGYKSWAVQTKLYTGCHIGLCVTILATAPLIFYGEHFEYGVLDYVRVICPFMGGWSMFYFVQILPGIGRFISSVCKMMNSLVLLAVVYFLMITPFVQSFYNFMNANSLQGCINGFNDFLDVVYSLFQIMLNMISLTSYEIVNSGLLYATHMTYIFLVAIMLINFFIAVMSESFSHVSQRGAAISTVQKAEVAFSAETLFAKLLSRYYRYATEKAFDKNEGEIVLIATNTKI